jgi:DNA repair exonuclease SbcCD nuclease subunit
MRILHTSDWHLGKPLEQIGRIEEQREFIDWLCKMVDEQRIDLVLVAGDIYDTYNPSAAAEELFYDVMDRTLQVGGALTVDPGVLPSNAHFIALGHLHRPQQIKNAPCPVYYSGSPLAYSFSEADYSKAVYIIDAVPGKKADINAVGHCFFAHQLKKNIACILGRREIAGNGSRRLDLYPRS